MVKCCVPGCGLSSREGIKMHIVPKNKELIASWSSAIGIQIDSEKRNRFMVCDTHFDLKCKFQTVRNRSNLKASAIPSLRLPKNVIVDTNTDEKKHDSLVQDEIENPNSCGTFEVNDNDPAISSLTVTSTTSSNASPFGCGLNPQIIKLLKSTVDKMDHRNRHCILMFQEMSLDTTSSKSKEFHSNDTFIVSGEGESMQCADHAMVFMLKGIADKWKQPVAYFFTNGSMKSADIKSNLKHIISELNAIGFKIVATVCDQMSSNTTAINSLIQDTEVEYKSKGKENKNIGFEINGHEIVPLYDPPHLLKQVRNHLMESNAQFMNRAGDVVIASWEDIVKLYEMDDGIECMRMCLKLTDQHIYPNSINQTSVKHAAQVLSQTVGAFMHWILKFGKPSMLPATAPGTSEFLLLFDRLFDSVNGVQVKCETGKELRSAIRNNCPHFKFWDNAIQILNSIKFIEQGNAKTVPSVQNWILTLNGFKHIWNKLKSDFKFLSLRNFNQDPIENFLESIKSHGVQIGNPTPQQFTHAYKTLIVNNLVSCHSAGTNCEDDENTLLCNLRVLLENEGVPLE